MQLTSRLNLGSTFKHTFRNSTSTIINNQSIHMYMPSHQNLELSLSTSPPFSHSKKPHNQKQLCVLQDLFTGKAVSKMFKFGTNCAESWSARPPGTAFLYFNYRG
uniref:(northern house mosquito) hypothetical protein n=1 Tax=Culex pipiens TaxID=7175 RepID=A0A8D8F117_CULPI